MKKKTRLLFISLILIQSIHSNAQCPAQAAYLFDGNADDASGNSFDGTLFGAATVDGYLEEGYNTSDYMELPADMMEGLGDFTMVFDFYLNELNLIGASPTNTLIAGASTSDEGAFALSYQADIGAICVALVTAPGHYFYVDLNAETWYCLKVVRNGSDVSVYIDGTLIETFVMSEETLDIAYLEFGQELDCPTGCFAENQCLNGRIDNFVLYDCVFANTACEFTPVADPEIADNDLTISPIPASDHLIVQMNNQNEYNSLALYTIDGNPVIRQSVNGYSNSINVAELPAGIYFLEAEGDAVRSRKMVVVE